MPLDGEARAHPIEVARQAHAAAVEAATAAFDNIVNQLGWVGDQLMSLSSLPQASDGQRRQCERMAQVLRDETNKLVRCLNPEPEGSGQPGGVG